MAAKIKNYNVTFVHVPKTGGCWAEIAMRNAGLGLKRLGHEHGNLDWLLHEEITLDGLVPFRLAKKWVRARHRLKFPVVPAKRFCVVRHPLKWYESFWRYKMDLNWEDWGKENSAAYWHPNSVLNDLGSSDFNEFIWNVLQKRPGYVTELYSSYTKGGMDFVGRTENLANDVVQILNELNIAFDEDKFRSTPRFNESKTPKGKIDWDPKLRDLVMRLELPSLIAYDYLSAEEAKNYGVGSVRVGGATLL